MIAKKSKSKQQENVLEGFTYEEIPSDSNTVEIPQEILDSAVIVDVKDSTEQINTEESSKIEKTESNSEVTFELPPIKEPDEQTILQQIEEKREKSVKRNRSRRVRLPEYVINLDDIELGEAVYIDFRSYATMLKNYISKGFLLKLMSILRDHAELSNEAMTDLLKTEIPNIMGSIVDAVLPAHKMVQSIEGSSQVALDKVKDSEEQQIQIAITTIIKFPDHVKSYESTDVIIIPA